MHVPELRPDEVVLTTVKGMTVFVLGGRLPAEVAAFVQQELSDREVALEVVQWLAKIAGGEAEKYELTGNAYELVIVAGGATVTNFLLPELGSWELTLPSLCLILTVWLRALGGPGRRAH